MEVEILDTNKFVCGHVGLEILEYKLLYLYVQREILFYFRDFLESEL